MRPRRPPPPAEALLDVTRRPPPLTPAESDRLIRITLSDAAGRDTLKGFLPPTHERQRIMEEIVRNYPEIPMPMLLEITGRLDGQAQCEWSDNLEPGVYVRQIQHTQPAPSLKNGGHIVEDQDPGADRLLLKKGRMIWAIKPSQCVIFRKLREAERAIIALKSRD